MREIQAKTITEKVKELFLQANIHLPADTAERIRLASCAETAPAAQAAMKTACDNLEAAERLNMAICQDTGMAVVFCELGQDAHIVGGSYEDAINEGVRQAYLEGYFRCSVVGDPLFERKNTADNTPAVIHTRSSTPMCLHALQNRWQSSWHGCRSSRSMTIPPLSSAATT
ncbi:MAG: fumarate hydratase [Clostridia bacterium]|nr:fumarate hydratase [Clostridia bacterium]